MVPRGIDILTQIFREVDRLVDPFPLGRVCDFGRLVERGLWALFEDLVELVWGKRPVEVEY